MVKTVPPHQIQKSHTIKNLLPCGTLVRLPVDEIEDPNALVFKHACEDLQQLMKRVKLSRAQIKRICHDILQAIAELHDVDWMHGGSFQTHLDRFLNLIDCDG